MKPNYYKVSYITATGKNETVTVKARNEAEAIANAKDNRFTGSEFKVLGLTTPTKDTVKGGGSHRAN